MFHVKSQGDPIPRGGPIDMTVYVKFGPLCNHVILWLLVCDCVEGYAMIV